MFRIRLPPRQPQRLERIRKIRSLDDRLHFTLVCGDFSQLGVPTGTLEGYLFPETYLLPEGSAARPIVRRLVSEFERRWKPEWCV